MASEVDHSILDRYSNGLSSELGTEFKFVQYDAAQFQIVHDTALLINIMGAALST